jgi:GNAT superfamily N-acetyltransferase
VERGAHRIPDDRVEGVQVEMGSRMAILVRTMTPDDLAFGMELKAQAGWNQVEADWRRALDLQPDGCFLAEREDAPVGTVTSCILGPVAWIAMMLVAEKARGQGIGRALMAHALAFLDRAGARSIRLDATPLGQPLYESLGFTADATILRYQGRPAPGARSGAVELPQGEPTDLDAVATIDRLATGTDRRRLIECLVTNSPDSFRIVAHGGSIAGYGLARPGSRAIQVGPCIASETAGPFLLGAAFHHHAGQAIIVDVPEAHRPAQALADAAGLTVARSFTRMTRGDPVAERLGSIWASSGPEMG